MNETLLSITEVEAQTGISSYTLRYYDKCGLFDTIYRDSRNRRKYSQQDLQRLEMIQALRLSGLSIEGIQEYCRHLTNDDVNDCMKLLKTQLVRLTLIQEQLVHAQQTIEHKLNQLKASEESHLETEVD